MKKALVTLAAVLAFAAPAAAGAVKKLPEQAPFEQGQGTENTRNGAGKVSQSAADHAERADRRK